MTTTIPHVNGYTVAFKGDRQRTIAKWLNSAASMCMTDGPSRDIIAFINAWSMDLRWFNYDDKNLAVALARRLDVTPITIKRGLAELRGFDEEDGDKSYDWLWIDHDVRGAHHVVTLNGPAILKQALDDLDYTEIECAVPAYLFEDTEEGRLSEHGLHFIQPFVHERRKEHPNESTRTTVKVALESIYGIIV